MPNIPKALARPMTYAVLIAVICLMACGQKPPKGETLTPEAGKFRIDTSGIGAGDVRFFNYRVDEKRVTFMVARTATGEFKTAFDACITCYPYRKGYVFDSGRVVCVECGTKFGLDELGTGKGNCIPIKIEHHMENGSLVIDQAEIEAGEHWF